jgi:hypothetical protein
MKIETENPIFRWGSYVNRQESYSLLIPGQGIISRIA